MSFHRHDDDLLQMECGANPDCGHFSCRFPWTPTDFAPRPACDCKNWRAPVEPVPAPRLEQEVVDALNEASRLIEDRYADSGWPSNSWRIAVEKWREKLAAVLSPPVGTQPKGD
jgi:hypothetical protein